MYLDDDSTWGLSFMLHDLISEVQAFGAGSVLLLGDLILDRYLHGDAERISPEAPVPILRVVSNTEALGGSANVAACLRALGIEVLCCGVVGTDHHGDRVLGLLEELGVGHEGVLRCPGRPTTAKTRLVGLAQHRHRQQLMRLDEETTAPLDEAEMGRVRTYIESVVSHVRAICIEDYDKGVVSRPLVEWVVRVAAEHGVPVLVDPARLDDYSRYAGATLLTPNRNELSMATGTQCNSIEQAAEAAQRLRETLAVDAIVVTLDRDGAVLVEKGRPWVHVPTRPRSVYDNTGAGDAVLAMLAAAVAAGVDLPDAVRLANVAGGLEVEKFGCVPITRDEVLADLRLTHDRQQGKRRSLEELHAELQLRQDRGATVVFTNGCYDLLHVGHVDFLQRCRDLGSVLVVGLNTDASVRRQNKGAGRPLNGELDRAKVLGALECVDYVVLFDDPTPLKLIERIKPDVLVKGEDWASKGVVGREFVEAHGGRVVLLPLVEGYSTTALVERIRNESRQL
ncbi:MAG: D-glycero-beta-D-manno-heptose 1-phosphate adenylyltransferase [Phycisphaerae bacterium]|nr:D-glycero-beta-D-manno-heptose 1-phosphate adenylyltransferase [Phycisphaerae bacterium]